MGGGNTIEFTVAGVTYEADDGMTWTEFIASTYNRGSAFYTQGSIVKCSGYNVRYNNVDVTPSATIIENGAYTLASPK